MPNVSELAREVLRDAHIAALGVADAEGPWIASVIFVHDTDYSIFWLSQPESRHSKAIQGNGKLAIAITASWDNDNERALQMEGTARRIESPGEKVAEALAAKRGRSKDEQAEKALERGLVWYQCTPSRIELIYNKHFGYERQRVL